MALHCCPQPAEASWSNLFSSSSLKQLAWAMRSEVALYFCPKAIQTS